MLFQSLNPATGELLATFAPHSPAAVEAALQQAATAAIAWGAQPVTARAELLSALADALDACAPALARLAALEMGKPLAQGVAEVRKCAATARYYAAEAPTLLAEEPLPLGPDGTRRLLLHEPLGVVLGVMPWNFPFWQVIRFAVPTLVAGNVVLVKHAPNVPQCAAALADVLTHVLPPGVYTDLRVAPETVADLLADPRVAAVSLTGSGRAGAAVAEAAGRHLKPAVLELGGADAFVVLASADVPRAAETAARARLLNAGQSCIAAKRFIIAREVVDTFLPLFIQHLAEARGGDPLGPAADALDYGPLARLDLAQALTRQVEASVAAGARVALAGGQAAPDGCLFRPVVLTHIPPTAPAAVEELFGPVAGVWEAADEADAIRQANATAFGLGGTVWGEPAAAARVARALRCGHVTLNGLNASSPELPFGGRGASGFGRELGALGIRQFTNAKTVVGLATDLA